MPLSACTTPITFLALVHGEYDMKRSLMVIFIHGPLCLFSWVLLGILVVAHSESLFPNSLSLSLFLFFIYLDILPNSCGRCSL